MAASEYDAKKVASAWATSWIPAVLVPEACEEDLEVLLRHAYAAGRDAGIEEAVAAVRRSSSTYDIVREIYALKGGNRG